MPRSLDHLAPKLRQWLSYDPETGVIVYREGRGKKRAGEEAGYVDSEGYRRIFVGGKMLRAHRVAWFLAFGVWPTKALDHVNRDKSDNRLVNLRECTDSQNMANTGLRSNNSSGVRGVSFCSKTRRWMVRIAKDRSEAFLGRFDCYGQAVARRRKAERSQYGAFAPQP